MSAPIIFFAEDVLDGGVEHVLNKLRGRVFGITFWRNAERELPEDGPFWLLGANDSGVLIVEYDEYERHIPLRVRTEDIAQMTYL